MTHRIPLDITYNDNYNVVTFIKAKGFNHAQSLFKYLEEEFPYAPSIELLRVVFPDLDDFLVRTDTKITEIESPDGILTQAPPDNNFWERVEQFRLSYKRWIKEVSSARYI